VRNLKSRIERIEKRVAADEKPIQEWLDVYYYMKVLDPEGLRRDAMDSRCWYHNNAHEALNSPTPKRILRQVRWAQMGLIKLPPFLSNTPGTADAEDDPPRRITSREEKHGDEARAECQDEIKPGQCRPPGLTA
jgi:hypothetical protein